MIKYLENAWTKQDWRPNMKIISDKNKCLELANSYYKKNEFEVLSKWELKKDLNDYFQPSDYLFFESNGDLIPLVLKDNFAYFFGGNLPFNDYNKFPNSRKNLNFCLKYLTENNIKFRLTSVKDDYYKFLYVKNKCYDVPFNQNWVIDDVSKFNVDTLIEASRSKIRNKIRKGLKTRDSLEIEKPTEQEYYKKYFEKTYKFAVEDFKRRDKHNVWETYPELYEKIIKTFFNNFKCINKVFISDDGEILSSYMLSINENEVYLTFINFYLARKLPNKVLQFATYLDAIYEAREYSLQNNISLRFNAGRGDFGYKSRMGFKPHPMYAIVKDKSWAIQRNEDIEIEETRMLYGREFGCFL